jgi:alkanesulfonate monooxygenase SsuD/methylene tetrahydromethanopterin reductase-like flavin-dependent oxidoreductase (luciferase family)
VEVDLLFDPFGVRVEEVLVGASAAGEAGFGGVWLYDHLAGSVHGRDRVVECWTMLTAIAATVPRIMVGPLVLNVANRPAGTLAVMAATVSASPDRAALDHLEGLGVDRAVVFVGPPFEQAVSRAQALLEGS